MTDYYRVKDSDGVELQIASELIDDLHYPKFSYETVMVSATSAGIVPTVAYDAKDALGTVLTFTDIARKPLLGGIIQSAVIVMEQNTAVPCRLLLFNSTVTATNNSPLALTTAQAKSFIGYIDFDLWEDVGASMVSSVTGIALGFKCISSKNLYGVLIPQANLTLDNTFPATGIVITLTANQD